jgi:hypothetical protein
MSAIGTTASLSVASLTLFGGAPALGAGTPSCVRDLARIRAGAPGPLVCTHAGLQTVLTAKQTTLPLSSMQVSFVSERTAHSVGGVVAAGVFVVLTIDVANETNTPQSFDGAAQADFELNDSSHFTSPEVGGADPAADAWAQPIAPGQSITGDLVFDVSKHALRSRRTDAALGLVNFGEDISSGPVSQLGIVVLGKRIAS